MEVLVDSVDLILNLHASQHMEIELTSGNLILNFDSAAEFPEVTFLHDGYTVQIIVTDL